MSNAMNEIFQRLIHALDIETTRYLYSAFDVSNRLTGLVGPRGVGKTTLMLQYIKNKLGTDDALYVSADNIYFGRNTLFDFVRDMYEMEGTAVFFIDEVHKYHGWGQELKNIYDSLPAVKVVFSGSSSMDLTKGAYDLSRRGVTHRLHGMSFREYLNFTTDAEYGPLDLDDIIRDHKHLSSTLGTIPRLKGHFREYLRKGYYPFLFESREFFYEKISNIIDKTIYEDIATYYNLKTSNLHVFKQILQFLCSIPPGEINSSNLAKALGIDAKTVTHYLIILAETGLVRLLYADKKGAALVRKPVKVFLDNTSLLCGMADSLGQTENLGTVRELFFTSMLQNAGEHVFYSKNIGDYRCRETVFEVGGRSKTRKQICDAKGKAFLVQDGILHGSATSIPLYIFGFLY
jgi:predicted AAA+ superfamily ATPase